MDQKDWLPGYGIRCNNCMTYFIDDNDVPLIDVTENGAGWEIHGCPNCKTDAYLMDAPGYEGGYWHGESHNEYLLQLTLYGAYCDYCNKHDTEIETFENFIDDP